MPSLLGPSFLPVKIVNKYEKNINVMVFFLWNNLFSNIVCKIIKCIFLINFPLIYSTRTKFQSVGDLNFTFKLKS